MSPGLTADDRRRIDSFVKVPRHRRRPEMLCPDSRPEQTEAERRVDGDGAER